MRTRVLLADDHRIVREGLKSLLELRSDFEVVGEAESGRTAIALAGSLLPDVVVMDVTMSDINGIEASRQIHALYSHIKILALSMHADKQFIKEMFLAGASGYLLKDCAGRELARAITTIMTGKTYLFSPENGTGSEDIVRYQRRTIFPPPPTPSLTSMEREVLRAVAEGLTTREIAVRLNASTKTIELHRQHIMDKVGLHTIAELTKYAIRLGLTTPEE